MPNPARPVVIFDELRKDPVRLRAWQAERQDEYRRIWRRQIEALREMDDERYGFMRTAGHAQDQGTGRGSSRHPGALPAAVAAHLDRMMQGKSAEAAPTRPLSARVEGYLGRAASHPFELAAARVALSEEQPDLSLALELTGWQPISQLDLERAFAITPHGGWSQASISGKVVEACSLLRTMVDRLTLHQDDSPQH